MSTEPMTIALSQAMVLIVIAVSLWCIAYSIGKISIIDIFWSLFFLAASCVAWLLSPGNLANVVLIALPLSLWALRLSIHLTIRSYTKGEDVRYAMLAKKYGHTGKTWALWRVFLPQVLLAFIVNWPITVAITCDKPIASRPVVIFGVTLFLVGFLIESIADAQLSKFQKNRLSPESILDQGLWGWSRHPNYFGEAVLWWGLYLISAGISGTVITIISPIVMTFLLMRVSGVTMLDELLKQTKPHYKNYMKNTSAFFPWPPKKPPIV